jgi:hypothetical protein
MGWNRGQRNGYTDSRWNRPAVAVLDKGERMIRLVDGAYGILGFPGEENEVGFLDSGRKIQIPDPYRSMFAKAAQSMLHDDTLESPELTYLEEAGVVARHLSVSDPEVQEHLEDMGSGYRWRVAKRPGIDTLIPFLRDIHSRRKLFVAYYGQTSCLPESAAARIHLLMENVPKGGRILLVGDDDFLSVPLAQQGFRVTVLDIDSDLVSYLGDLANEFDVEIDARVHNMLHPFPADLVEAVDAAMTDPMSHQNCLQVFIGRALAAVPVGKPVFTCLHPLARRVFHDVIQELPADIEKVYSGFSAYYINRFEDVDYRSDMLQLQRNRGQFAVAPEDPMPNIDVTLEELPYPPHGFSRVFGMRFGSRQDFDAETVVQYFIEESKLPVIHHFSHEDGPYIHLRLELPEHTFASLVIDRKRFRGGMHLYPHDLAMGHAVVDGIEAFIRRQAREYMYPYLPQFSSSVLLSKNRLSR